MSHGVAEELITGFEDLRHSGDDSIPLALFIGKLSPSCGSQFIGLHTFALLVGAPLAGNPSLRFQAMQSGEQRSRRHVKSPAGDLPDTIGHADSVKRLERQ